MLRLIRLAFAVGILTAAPVRAYVEAPHSLGTVVAQATHIMLVRVEAVDKQKNMIIYRKVQDIKGKHPTDVIKHNIGRGGFNPREWQYPMEWAEPGKTAVFFHNGGASEMCIGTYWYQAYAGGEWWNMSHGEPFLLRSFAGRPEKLVAAITEILQGKEVVVPCMVDGNKDDLHLRRARIQRLKASLKLTDYNPKRDFVGWGGEDFRRLAGMPGFTHFSALGRIDPDALAVSSVDIDGDGRLDLCLSGANRIALLLNSGESLSEVSLPVSGGCRAAAWADYNGDGKPDLLLATPSGPRLFTNEGGGALRDDTHLLSREPGYNLTAAAWIDQDGDGKADILLGNGFHGLRLYRNAGAAPAVKPALRLGPWKYIGPFDNAGQRGFNAVYPPEKELDFSKTYPGRGGETAAWKEGKFTDGNVNGLTLFRPENNNEAVVYLHREIECNEARELSVSLGSDDGLVVWLNGQKLLSQDVYRAAGADQAQVVLKLRAGKNDLLLKITQGTGEWGFYFLAQAKLPPVVSWRFEDASAAVGLGAGGLGNAAKGHWLTVFDADGDSRADVLYGVGRGLLLRNTPGGFVESANLGLTLNPGRTGPLVGDFDGDDRPDLFAPHPDGCRLFHNEGGGRFTDVTAKAGDLGRVPGAVSAGWGDIDRDGRLDLIVGCLRGPNRYLRNKGDGSFEDASESLGLLQRVFNTQAVGLVDLNKDGALDLVLNNEGQESAVLLGAPVRKAERTTEAQRAQSEGKQR